LLGGEANGEVCIDCETGRRLGVEYLKYCQRAAMPLGWVVDSMPRELTGIEIGFLRKIGQAAALGY